MYLFLTRCKVDCRKDWISCRNERSKWTRINSIRTCEANVATIVDQVFRKTHSLETNGSIQRTSKRGCCSTSSSSGWRTNWNRMWATYSIHCFLVKCVWRFTSKFIFYYFYRCDISFAKIDVLREMGKWWKTFDSIFRCQ